MNKQSPLSTSADSAPVYRPDMTALALIGCSVSLDPYPIAFSAILTVLPSPSSCLYAPSSGSYTQILVTSNYIRWSRTSVPVTMASSICSSSTRTKQWNNLESVRSTRANESIERFLNCLKIYSISGSPLLVRHTPLLCLYCL
jgi:hypothetical protein